jgi:hypothetical protein
MLIYVLQWWPSWISNRHTKFIFCKRPSNDHSWAVWFLDGPLQILGFLFQYKKEDGGYSRTKFNIGPYGKGVSKRFISETTWTIETPCGLREEAL